MTTSTGAQSI